MLTDKIQIKVNECIQNRELDFPLPINQIVSEHGFTVKCFIPNNDPDLIKISGAIEYNKKIIWINSEETVERQRFTTAHELGHGLLHPEENIIDYRMTGCFSQKESEANEFAGRLLMPEKEIQKVKQLLENMEGKSILSELACYFGVSMQAIMLRLQKLGIK